MTENEFVTEAGGFRFATSTGGTLTGRGGDFIIIDDPLKPEDALSDRARNATNDWYRSTLLSRLDDKQKSVLILVMQRLHVNDLTGFIEAGGGFHKLALPAIAEREEFVITGEYDTWQRAEGDALHEGREDRATLEAIRDQMGPFNFAAQYQQNPESPEGSLFKVKWFQLIQEPPAPAPSGQWVVSIDTALSTAETADHSVLMLTYICGGRYYVLHVDRGRWDYETLWLRVHAMLQRYGRDIWFLVEAAGAGISLVSTLQKQGLRCLR